MKKKYFVSSGSIELQANAPPVLTKYHFKYDIHLLTDKCCGSQE